jgi:heme/copper-type cytochrome/quinol oxidase subunit 2
MEVLANISLDTLRVLTWVVAIVVAVLWCGILWVFLASQKRYWEISSSIVQSLLVGAAAFFLLNLGVAFYILSHLTDSRWSVGKDPLLSPNDIQTNIPFLDEFEKQINDVQHGVAGAVNNVAAIQHAFSAASYFLVTAFIAIGVVLALALLTLVTGIWARRRAEKQKEYDNQYRDERLDNLERSTDTKPPIRKR